MTNKLLLFLLSAALRQIVLAQAPTITGFSPTSGQMGTSVIITGTGFTGTTSVRFGEKSASFTVNSSTQITAIVPRGASRQPINVTNASGYGLSPSDFTVTRASSTLTYSLVANNFGGVSGSTEAAPTVGDLDNDGRLDLLVGRADGTVIRYEQTATNATTFTNLGSLSDASGTINMGGRVSVCIVDANGDGRFSLLLGRPDGLVYEYEQTAVNATTFNQVTTNFGEVATTTYAVVGMTDFNRDGVLEFLTGKGDNFVGYFNQNGVNTTGFSRVNSNFLDLTNNTFPFCIDLDGNGLIDVLIGEGGGKMYRFEQNSVNSSSLTQITNSFNGIDVGTNAKPCVTDIDGDGLLDVLIGRADGTIDRYEQGASTIPTITGFVATSTTVCVGSPVTFTATVGNVSGSYTYTITNGTSTTTGNSANISLSQSIPASGSGVQSFTLIVNENSQSAIATTTVTVNALPSVNLTNNGPLSCTLTTVTLTATAGSSYTFTNSGGTVLIGSGNTRSVNAAGIYSVRVANASGCVSTTTTTVTSTSLLSLSSGSSLPQANVGVVVSLTASGATSYQWIAPPTAPLTSPSTGSAVSASLITPGVQTFTVVATSGVCNQSALVSMTALAGPDLSAIINLPDANFTAGDNKGILVRVQEVNGALASGNIIITLTVPAGYSVSFDNTLTTINVSGGSTTTVQNNQWHQSNMVAGQQISIAINNGQSVGANSTMNLGFSLTRTSANAGSVSNITVNIADDSGGSYDVNRLNNVYARIINGL